MGRIVAALFAFLLVFASGCNEAQEKQEGSEPRGTAQEKAIASLKSKGASITWFDPKNVAPPVAPYWSATLRDPIADTDLDHLKQIKPLKSLGISSPRVTDQGIAKLAELDNLKSLTFMYLSEVTDRGVDKLADLGTLEKLTLREMKITGEGFKRFGRLKKLKYLVLVGLPITDDGLKGLKGLKRLEHLDLSGTKVSDDGLKFLKNLGCLEHLNLNGTRVTDAGMAELADHPSLKSLWLGDFGGPVPGSWIKGTAVGNEGVKLLSRSKSLQSLNLANTKVDDEGLKHIPAFANLTGLTLMNTRISDEGLKHLQKAKMKSLSLIFGNNDKITDQGLRHLQQMKTLKRLWLETRGTKITAEGLRQFRNARPDLKIQANLKK